MSTEKVGKERDEVALKRRQKERAERVAAMKVLAKPGSRGKRITPTRTLYVVLRGLA